MSDSARATPTTLICVFAKPPVAGIAKTRLAAKVGVAAAAALARAFLQDTWAAVSTLGWARPVLATTGPGDFGLAGEPALWLQGEGDLGARLERILQRALAEADCVLAIGADSPGLPPRVLVDAHERLARSDAVLGPAVDGGFYWLGLKRCPPGLFDGLPWSASTTFVGARRRLEAHRMTVGILEPWFDVDRPADLEHVRALIARGELDARETAKTLETLP